MPNGLEGGTSEPNPGEPNVGGAEPNPGSPNPAGDSNPGAPNAGGAEPDPGAPNAGCADSNPGDAESKGGAPKPGAGPPKADPAGPPHWSGNGAGAAPGGAKGELGISSVGPSSNSGAPPPGPRMKPALSLCGAGGAKKPPGAPKLLAGPNALGLGCCGAAKGLSSSIERFRPWGGAEGAAKNGSSSSAETSTLKFGGPPGPPNGAGGLGPKRESRASFWA